MIRWPLPFVYRLKLNLPTSSTFNYANLTRNIATTSLLCQVTPSPNEKLKIAEFQAGVAKPNFNIVTIGHVDHGKTTLTAAITKYLSEKGLAKFVDFAQIDKPPEEQRRELTINIAHVGYESPKGDRRYSHTDYPELSDYVKNMICGTAQMDAAILVIDADDGVMPQTREHVLLAKQIGIKQLIVFLNKIDKVDQDTIKIVEIETSELLEEFGFYGEQTPIIKGSALSALEGKDTSSIDQLLEAMDALPIISHEKPFYMPLTRRTVKKNGVIIVGTIEQGTVKNGDLIQVKEGRRSYYGEVHSCVVDQQFVESVKTGDQCSIFVNGLTRDMVMNLKEAIVCQNDTYHASNFFGVLFYYMSRDELTDDYKNLQRVQTGVKGFRFIDKDLNLLGGVEEDIYCGRWKMKGKLYWGKSMEPGTHATGYLFLHLLEPVKTGSHFVMRHKNHEFVHGIITHIYHPLASNYYKGRSVNKHSVNELIKTRTLITEPRANEKKVKKKVQKISTTVSLKEIEEKLGKQVFEKYQIGKKNA